MFYSHAVTLALCATVAHADKMVGIWFSNAAIVRLMG